MWQLDISTSLISQKSLKINHNTRNSTACGHTTISHSVTQKTNKQTKNPKKIKDKNQFFPIDFLSPYALAAASSSPPMDGLLGRFLGNLSLPLMG